MSEEFTKQLQEFLPSITPAGITIKFGPTLTVLYATLTSFIHVISMQICAETLLKVLSMIRAKWWDEVVRDGSCSIAEFDDWLTNFSDNYGKELGIK